MSLPRFALLFCCCLYANGDEREQWFTPPDGFRWPAPAEIQLSEVQEIATSTLTPQEKAAIRTYWPEEELPNTLRLRQVDLNSDGRDELFVYVPAYSGTGGVFQLIFSPTESGLRRVGGVQGTVMLLESSDGWLQLEVSERGDRKIYGRALFRFVDGEYRFYRGESHDHESQEVTIRGA
jgi:hypothetical protein